MTDRSYSPFVFTDTELLLVESTLACLPERTAKQDALLHELRRALLANGYLPTVTATRYELGALPPEASARPMTDSRIELEDLRAASFVLGPSAGPDELDIDAAPIVTLLRETEHLWAGRAGVEVALWAVMIGILADRHRIHRLEHDG